MSKHHTKIGARSKEALPRTTNSLKIIGIPDSLTIYDMMVVGYEDNPPGHKIVRDIDEMMYYDECGKEDFRTDEEVKAYAEITRTWCLSEH